MDINGYATGAVQVFQDGAFGAVCKTGFDEVAANVACRQLGFMSGTLIPLAQRGKQSPEELKALIEVCYACRSRLKFTNERDLESTP